MSLFYLPQNNDNKLETAETVKTAVTTKRITIVKSIKTLGRPTTNRTIKKIKTIRIVEKQTLDDHRSEDD